MYVFFNTLFVSINKEINPQIFNFGQLIKKIEKLHNKEMEERNFFFIFLTKEKMVEERGGGSIRE